MRGGKRSWRFDLVDAAGEIVASRTWSAGTAAARRARKSLDSAPLASRGDIARRRRGWPPGIAGAAGPRAHRHRVRVAGRRLSAGLDRGRPRAPGADRRGRDRGSGLPRRGLGRRRGRLRRAARGDGELGRSRRRFHRGPADFQRRPRRPLDQGAGRRAVGRPGGGSNRSDRPGKGRPPAAPPAVVGRRRRDFQSPDGLRGPRGEIPTRYRRRRFGPGDN